MEYNIVEIFTATTILVLVSAVVFLIIRMCVNERVSDENIKKLSDEITHLRYTPYFNAVRRSNVADKTEPPLHAMSIFECDMSGIVYPFILKSSEFQKCKMNHNDNYIHNPIELMEVLNYLLKPVFGLQMELQGHKLAYKGYSSTTMKINGKKYSFNQQL